jgi:hypothetical protein
MQNYLLPILIVSPLLIAGIAAFAYSQSLVSVVLVLVGAIGGAILVVPSGVVWLQVLCRNWIESQAAGFVFVPVVLPLLAYVGAIAGASLVAILSIDSVNHGSSLLEAIAIGLIAIGLTVVFAGILAGLMPSALLFPPPFLQAIPDRSGADSRFLIAIAFAMGAGVASSSLASQLAHFLVGRFT